MSSAKKLTGAALAAAAAGIFAMAPISGAVAGESKVHCYGVNSCKGMGACKTATNACKGHNACKGTGFVSISAADCKEKGGTTSPKEM